jgi:predicted acetyltransferase
MDTSSREYEGPRGATTREFGEVLDFVNFVFRSDQGRRPSMGGDYPHLYNESNVENFRHIRHDGRIVSCVNIYPSRVQWGDAVLSVGGIGGVATDPEYRSGGLAGRNLEDSLDHMTRSGMDISILWTGINDYYRRWGWEDAGRKWSFSVSRTTISYLPSAPSGEILTDPYDDAVIDGVCELHAQQTRGAIRDRELTKTMLGRRTRHCVALLRVDGAPLAYIVHGSGERFGIMDYGGDPEAVLGLIRIVFAEQGARYVGIDLPAEDTGVASLFLERGFQAQTGYQGMIAVLNPQNIVKQYGLDDLSFEAVPGEDGRPSAWNVTYGDVTTMFGPNDLAKFLFGPERPPEMSHPKLPLPFVYGDLDHM